MSKKYKLTYFDIRGRAELIRLLFYAAGKESELEDERVSFQEWPEKKKAMPRGQMPVLEVDGKQHCESLALARYIAQTLGLHPKDLKDQLIVDGILDELKDILGEIFKEYFNNGMTKEALRKVITEKAPPVLKDLESKLPDKGKFFISSSVTMADLFVYEILTDLIQADSTVLDEYPKLRANMEAVRELPKLKKYLKERKVTDI